MKNSQTVATQPNQAKRQCQRQLKQLYESYCLYIGTDILPVLSNAFFQSQSSSKQNIAEHNRKMGQKQEKIFWGNVIILATAFVLVCTMVGIFEYRVVLIFGIFWGFVFTRNTIKLDQDIMEIVVYWTILSLSTAMQDILRLGMFFMPFYHSLKLFFIISLLYPKINLKEKIYKNYFLPRINDLSQKVKI